MNTVDIKSYAGLGAGTSEFPPDDALYVRPSGYAGFSLCGYRTLYEGEDGFDNASGEAPGFGTGVHKFISTFIRGETVPASDDLWLEAWAQEMGDRGEDLYSYASRGFLLDKVNEMQRAYTLWLDQYWEPYGKYLETLAAEETVMKGLGVLPSGREVWVRGTPDRVTPGKITDWKTAGRGWKEGKAQASAVQIITYGWLSAGLTEVTEGEFVVYNREKPSWSRLPIPIDEGLMQLALRSMWDVARSIHYGMTVATPHVRGGFGDGRGWHCSPKFCPAWNPCLFKHQIPDGKGTQVRSSMRWE